MEREKLKKIEIDLENDKYEINGKNFTNNCSYLSITYEDGTWDVTFKNTYFGDGTYSNKNLSNKFGNKINKFN